MSLTSGDSDGAAATRCSAFSASARRLASSERQHRVDDEIITRAVGAVEFLLVAESKGMDQGTHAIGIGEREAAVRGQCLDAVERRRLRNARLQREPLVDDQRIVGMALVEI